MIRRYTSEDENALFSLMEREGEEWGYWQQENRFKYTKALGTSLTYLAYEDDVLCGFCRCRDDDGFGVYIYDLLVDKKYRGKGMGRKLMARVKEDFPEDPVYVMSDVDPYYEKQGFQREGSIFEVCFPG